MSIKIFIIHSSRDIELVGLIVRALEESLEIPNGFLLQPVSRAWKPRLSTADYLVRWRCPQGRRIRGYPRIGESRAAMVWRERSGSTDLCDPRTPDSAKSAYPTGGIGNSHMCIGCTISDND